MTIKEEILKPVVQSPAFPELLDKLNVYWQEEQKRRQAFYDWVTPDMKAEFIEGEVVVHSPVHRGHNLVSGMLYALLNTYVFKHDLGFVGIEKIMIRLTRNDYEPDICFFNKAKSDGFEASQTLFPPPDFVAEITSPSTEARDRGLKFEDYARHGVAEYWIIDPDTETISQYFLEGGAYRLQLSTQTGTLHSRAVSGFALPARAIFDKAVYFEALGA